MKTFKSIIFSFAAALGLLTSCSDGGPADLTGKYAPPIEVNYTSVSDGGVTEDNYLNIVTVNLASAENNTMSIAFVCAKKDLTSGEYGASASTQVGRYLVSQSTVTIGGQKHSIDHGSIIVTNENTDYTFSGLVWLDDESVVKFTAKGILDYSGYAPVATPIVNLYQADATKLEGTDLYQIDICIAEPQLSATRVDGATTFSGSGHFAQLTFISKSPKLAEGVYTPASATPAATDNTYTEGTFLRGCLYNLVLIPGVLELPLDIYSTWIEVVDGQQQPNGTYLNDGTISVSKSGENYDIVIESTGIFARYNGSIDFNIIGGGDEPVTPGSYSYTLSTKPCDDNAANTENTIQILDGSKVVANLMCITSGNAPVAGKYSIVETGQTPYAPGQFLSGVNFMGFLPLGTYIVDNGVNFYVTAGTLEISETGGKLNFKLSDIVGANDAGAAYPSSEFIIENVAKK